MNHKHAKILEKIFHHPISHDIQWNEVMKLFKGLDATIEINKHSGKTIVSFDELSIVLPKQTHKIVSNHKEIIEIRHFLEQSGHTP